jgi:ribosomal protein S24E
MELKIISQDKSVAMQRTTVTATVSYAESTTPKRAEIQDAIAKKCKSEPQLVIVDRMNAGFGETQLEVSAYVYDSEKALKTMENDFMVKRNEVVVPEPVEEPAAEEAPAAEAPAEEKTEEAPAAEAEEKKE